MATMPPKHHQPLHNFSLPLLQWGHRVQPNNCRRRHRHRHGSSPPTDSSDSDLNNLNNRRRFSNITKQKINEDHQSHKNGVVLPENANGNASIIGADVATADDGDVKPWKLRPRRLVIDTVDGAGVAKRMLRGGVDGEDENEKEYGKKRRLWISLSKEEIEEDVYAFTGSRPVRRPKKRNRTAQKHVDNVFPGLYLVGVSADSYRV